MIAAFWVLVFLAAVFLGEGNVCTNNRYKTGAWKKRSDLHNATKSFHCCGIEWSGDDYLHDTKTCGTERGNWNFERGNTQHETHTTGYACTCDIAEGRYTVNSIERYEWVPQFCSLLKWNATQFCDLLGNRTILFVGDSTMHQSATTVMSMVTRGGGRCANQLVSGKSYLLFFATENTTDMFSLVREVQPDICIMTAGPHCEDLGDIYSVLENVKNEMPQLREWSPRTKYVWKTNNPGHTDCKNYTKPLAVPVVNDHDVYNYHNFPAYDKAAYEYAGREGWRVIDMSPLYLRPDAHSDCMHSVRWIFFLLSS